MLTRIDDSRVVTLAGSVHPLARPEFDQGAASPETRLDRMVLVLQAAPAQQAALDKLVEAQHNPNSPQFHRWLTPAQFGARFGVSAGDRARIAAWLSSKGFAVEPAPEGGRLLIFSGAADQVAAAFHTQVHRYLAGGVAHLANSQDPQIPAALAPIVAGVLSLHDFRRAPQTASRRPAPAPQAAPRPQWNLGGSHYLFPADYAAIYNLNPLYAAGTTGAGASIAIAGRSNLNLADVAAFRAAAGLPAAVPDVILTGTDPGLVPVDQDEATLDVEWAGAVAQGAHVKLVTAQSTATTDGIDLAAAAIVNQRLAPVVSVSYSSCEQAMGPAELAFYNGLWEQAASQGMSVLVSSGDSGAAGCAASQTAAAADAGVNGLCTSPWVTCVGGTQFNEGGSDATYWDAANTPVQGSARGYIPEVVWNESALHGGNGLWASGGGSSRVYSQPAWQQGVAGSAAANGMRAVPDVSMTAAAHDGLVIHENGSAWIVSGTSAAAPAFAGLMALVVQGQGGAGQGSANPGLYALAASSASPFHAIQSGDNSVPGVPGFSAGAGRYNLATGLGSVDADLFVQAWGALTAPSPTLALAAPAGPLRAAPGASATVGLSVATGGPFAGDVQFSVGSLPAGVTAVWSANPVTPRAGSAAVTLTLKASPQAQPGVSVVTINARGDGLTATAQLQFQLAPARLRPSAPRLPDASTRRW